MAKGFAGARTTSIAEAAGVTHAMFHYYFRTKEKLFEKIISEKVALLKEALIGSIADPEAPLDVIIKDLINIHLDFLASNSDLPRFVIGEIYSNPERSAIFLDNLHKIAPTFTSFLQQKIDIEANAGTCRRVDARMLLLDIVSLNVFPYIASPVVNAALDGCMEDASEFLTRRKEDNFNTIMSKLKP